MGGFDVSYAGAFAAGTLTFLSPCILPLVPAYLCFISGQSLEQITAPGGTRGGAGVFWPGLAFVLGLSAVFIAMGATASGLGQFVASHKRTLAMVGGGVIILFGLHYMGLFRLPFLNFEKRVHLQNKPAGLAGSALVGMAFGFGWTPCVGPVLTTILMLAATGEDASYGMILLSVFAAGLGVPFLLAALAAGPFMRFLARFRRHMRRVELGMGALLVLTGVLMISGGLADVSGWLFQAVPILQEIG